MSDVLFVVMPFGGLENPHLGVSSMKAQLRVKGVRAGIAYLNFAFAEAVGFDAYGWLTNPMGDPGYEITTLAGEWMFARDLFGHTEQSDDAYIAGFLRGRCHWRSDAIDRLQRMARLVRPFLDHCMTAVDWQRYSVIGFTSTFEQNLASLALAKRLKAAFPDKTVVMGGANCAGGMGVALHEQFSFLDYVFVDYADFSFPDFVDRLARRDGSHREIGGVVYRDGVRSIGLPSQNEPVLDALPYPDFDDYFDTYRRSPLAARFAPMLHIEFSRGCWWGAKHRCSFCGINQDKSGFRAKSAERALAESLHLVARYGINTVAPADTILSMDYFRTFLPELRRRRPGIDIVYVETKANLRKEYIKLMRDAGISSIQPGIESLSARMLTLMNKGASPLQNIQLLKWCREAGLYPIWNILYGLPGEREEDYEELCRRAADITHLAPPVGAWPISLHRFSPYFECAGEFGIRNIRAYPSYAYVYPFEETVLSKLAYFFEFDFDGKEKIEDWSRGVAPLIAYWQQVHAFARLEVVTRTLDLMVVRDTRPNRVAPIHVLDRQESAVIDACDKVQSLAQLAPTVGDADNNLGRSRGIDGVIQSLARRRLIMEHEGCYLSLVVSPPRGAPLHYRVEDAGEDRTRIA